MVFESIFGHISEYWPYFCGLLTLVSFDNSEANTLLSTVDSPYWENAPVKSIQNELPCMHSQLNFIAVLQHIQRDKCVCVRKCDANEWVIKIEKWFGNQMAVPWNKIEKFWN